MPIRLLLCHVEIKVILGAGDTGHLAGCFVFGIIEGQREVIDFAHILRSIHGHLDDRAGLLHVEDAKEHLGTGKVQLGPCALTDSEAGAQLVCSQTAVLTDTVVTLRIGNIKVLEDGLLITTQTLALIIDIAQTLMIGNEVLLWNFLPDCA